MTTASPKLIVAPGVRELGVDARHLIARGLANRESDAAFDAFKAELAETLLARYTDDFMKKDPILAGFRELRRKIGRSNRRYPASTEGLIGFLRRTGTIPSINLVVDIYNAVSLETRLTLGAHDVSKVVGNIILKVATGEEHFLPLGSDKTEKVAPGDYCYVDESGEVLCRLDYRQADRTKVTIDTTHCFFIVQGNPNTSSDYIEAGVTRLAALLQEHCSGEHMALQFPS